MTRREILICDCCQIEYDDEKMIHGEDWLTPGFMPSFSQYLKHPVTEICGNCAKKVANYIGGLRNE